jgi:hypothetical protein
LGKDNDILEIKFSKKYKRNQKIFKITIPLIFFSLGFVNIFRTEDVYKNFLLIVPLLTVLTLVIFGLFLYREGQLPTKVRINDKGIYFWRRNKKEELVPWKKIYKIHRMDKLTPNDYVAVINKKGYNRYPKWTEFRQEGLDYKSAQIAIRKFNEYKAKKKSKK